VDGEVLGQHVEADLVSSGEHDAPLHDVVQLADVARPGMGLECAERVVEMDSAPAFDAK
jgi:hypothetical protein